MPTESDQRDEEEQPETEEDATETEMDEPVVELSERAKAARARTVHENNIYIE